MRHSVYGKKLGRTKNERIALFRGLVRSLILHESIVTTEAKAKAIKGLVDKLVTASRKKTSASLRTVESFLPDPEINQKLISQIAPRFSSRTSGFTNLIRLGNRKGDGAMMVQMSFLDKNIKESDEKEVAKIDEVKKEPKKLSKKPAVKAKK